MLPPQKATASAAYVVPISVVFACMSGGCGDEQLSAAALALWGRGVRPEYASVGEYPGLNAASHCFGLVALLVSMLQEYIAQG